MDKPVPTDLCPAHTALARHWHRNHYNPQSPSEWPVGLSATLRDHRSAPLLMDSRTTDEERAHDFERKNQTQIESVIQICRSGRSPQCSPALLTGEAAKTPRTAAAIGIQTRLEVA
ncbi:hypothetical protein OG432_24670 [Streptomyces sp. NBC_00442]|uniref:hypothetical protein n=1 Tax=Streptomyces sp. NBC_00442 TaxID=2903651 RepID=UPI002E20E7A3